MINIKEIKKYKPNKTSGCKYCVDFINFFTFRRVYHALFGRSQKMAGRDN
jgi:hypothetical protein